MARSLRQSDRRSISDTLGPIEEYAPGRFRVKQGDQTGCEDRRKGSESQRPGQPCGEPVRSPFRSKLEASYAQYLEALRHAGEIQAWRYEPMRFVLAKKTSYCPDFLVVGQDGHIEFREVKGGFVREDSWVKVKVSAQQFPWFAWAIVRKRKGCWEHTPIGPQREGLRCRSVVTSQDSNSVG